MLAAPWCHFYHPDVRNLAWTLASPALLHYLPQFDHPLTVLDDTFWQKQYRAYLPRLYALDAEPRLLTDFLAQHNNHRLGYYFEYLLLFWLQDSAYHPFELLKHRATIYQGKKTIGELDFLIRHQETGEIEHWEVAIKFYLGHPPITEAWQWLGPNLHDSLGAKLEHLATQQFRFQHYAPYTIQRRCLLVKGQLFYPPTLKPLTTRYEGPTLACLSAQHMQGNWLLFEDFLQNPVAQQLWWRHTDRNEWLAHQQPTCTLPLTRYDALIMPQRQRPELFIGFNDAGEEQARCFLVADAAYLTPPHST